MINLPEYLFMENNIYFRIINNSNQTFDFQIDELINSWKKKRYPLNIYKYNEKQIFVKIIFSINDEDIYNKIRKLVGTCITKRDFDLIIFNLIKTEYLQKPDLDKAPIKMVLANNFDKSIKKILEGSEFGKKWKIPKIKLTRVLKIVYKERLEQFKNLTYEHDLSYFSLPCVKPLLTLGGIPGQRNFGAKIIAFACFCEKITKSEAIKVGKYYFERTKYNSNHPDFELNEVLDWINWIYEKKDIHWTCRTPQNISECNKNFCRIVKDYYRKYKINESDYIGYP